MKTDYLEMLKFILKNFEIIHEIGSADSPNKN